MTALEKLLKLNDKGKFICVGLDPDIKKIPAHLKFHKNPIYEFNKEIIKHTAEHVAAFKPNFAFYEQYGIEGVKILEETIALIPKDVLIIGDAKKGDIGNTAKSYADSIFNYFKCDASTINPYMGEDSVLPFLEHKDKLNFILALTSNPGANDFEKLLLNDGRMLFQKVIEKVKEWNSWNNCGIVFGATKIDELKANISSFDDLPVLLPGVGAQGGSLEEVIKTFKENGRKSLLVNISRGVIYKGSGKNFAEEAALEVIKLNESVKKILGE